MLYTTHAIKTSSETHRKSFSRADEAAKNYAASDLLIITVFTMRVRNIFILRSYISREIVIGRYTPIPRTEPLIIFLTMCDLRLPCMIQISLVAEQEGGEIGWQA